MSCANVGFLKGVEIWETIPSSLKNTSKISIWAGNARIAHSHFR